MIITIDLSKMTHLKEKSFYNYNFYAFGNCYMQLLQVLDEEYNTCDYYLIEDGNKVFLGSADGDTEEEINFMYKYT